jgi:aminoglycoside phosphotransferase (APT) family kinase protein
VTRRPTPSDLRRDYGLDVIELVPHAGGWESVCWVADDEWFVKTWHDAGRANLGLLIELAARGLPVPAPLPNPNHAPYAVFPYVHGRPADHDGDWRVTARALRAVHDVTGVDVPPTTLDERECIDGLRDRLEHPWIADRADVVTRAVDRLEEVIERARATVVPSVLVHNDFGGQNLLIDDDGEVAAIVDWDWAMRAPREHDLWIAAEGPHITEFLDEYGACDLDATHLEYGLLARGVRDLAARVVSETDRPGVDTWGFDRIAKVDRDLAIFRPYIG